MGESAVSLILDPEKLSVPRPRTRRDCIDGPRPCPWAGCKYHLLVDIVPGILNRGRRQAPLVVHGNRGQHTETRITVDLDQVVDVLFGLPCTCVLDVAAHADRTLEETGQILGLTREAARLIERRACQKLGLEGEPPWRFRL